MGPAMRIIVNGAFSQMCRHLRCALEQHSDLFVINMATKGDVEMADAEVKVHDPNDYADLLQTNHCDAFAFSKSEKLALYLYDQLQELELQQSLLQAQQSGTLSMFTCSNIGS